MSDQELRERLERIERAARDKGHTFILFALLILLARGC